MTASCPRLIPRLAAGVLSLALASSAQEAVAQANRPSSSTNRVDSPGQASLDPIARIREEGLNRSQVLSTLSYLTDVIGPRLTGSPNLRRANEWTRDRLVSWGISNAQLEAWGPFGRGWSLKRFAAQVIEPQPFQIIGYPKAWSPGFDWPLVANAVLIDAKTDADLEKFKGRLKGAIALVSSSRDIKARFEAPASRLTEPELLRLANSSGGRGNVFAGQRSAPTSTNSSATPPPREGRGGPRSGSRTELNSGTNDSVPSGPAGHTRSTPPPSGQASATNATNAPGGSSRASGARALSPNDRFLFAVGEGAALIVSSSRDGDGGTVFVEAATPISPAGGTNARPSISRTPAWSTNAPAIPPQMVLASEDFNRLVRISEQGLPIRMAVDFQAQFHQDDLMACNTIAEIPGTDLKEEIVMLGAHLDSWHSGTGATDNGAGVAVTMEAMRILQALDLRPRRTIRLGLWSGEEQGLLGSRAYVNKHFGYYTNATNAANVVPARSPRDERGGGERGRFRNNASRSDRKLIRHPDYDHFSAYFNLDNGTGKIRGVYLQGNEAARSSFRRWGWNCIHSLQTRMDMNKQGRCSRHGPRKTLPIRVYSCAFVVLTLRKRAAFMPHQRCRVCCVRLC